MGTKADAFVRNMQQKYKRNYGQRGHKIQINKRVNRSPSLDPSLVATQDQDAHKILTGAYGKLAAQHHVASHH